MVEIKKEGSGRHSCHFEQCYYNIEKGCGVSRYLVVPDGLVQVPAYCPYMIGKENEE